MDTSDNFYSTILPKSLLNDSTLVVLVCSQEDSRSIFIEYIDPRFNKKVIEQYSLHFGEGNFGSDVASKWQHKVLDSEKSADAIKFLKNKSDTFHEYKIKNSSYIFTFKKCMDKLRKEKFILNGEQDEGIEESLQSIGQTMNLSSRCSIS